MICDNLVLKELHADGISRMPQAGGKSALVEINYWDPLLLVVDKNIIISCEKKDISKIYKINETNERNPLSFQS